MWHFLIAAKHCFTLTPQKSIFIHDWETPFVSKRLIMKRKYGWGVNVKASLGGFLGYKHANTSMLLHQWLLGTTFFLWNYCIIKQQKELETRTIQIIYGGGFCSQSFFSNWTTYAEIVQETLTAQNVLWSFITKFFFYQYVIQVEFWKEPRDAGNLFTSRRFKTHFFNVWSVKVLKLNHEVSDWIFISALQSRLKLL